MTAKKQILLIYPGHFGEKDPNFPNQLLCLAKPLLQAGISVEILDTRIKDYRNFDFSGYSVIGVSVMTANYELARAITRTARQANRAATIVHGGHHPTLMPKEVLRDNPEIDVVVCGEGEVPFLELCRDVTAGNTSDILSIAGVASRKDADIVINPQGPEIDLDTTDDLPYSLLNVDDYPKSRERFELYTSRGCPHNCAFCSNSVGRKRWRGKSAEVMLKELQRAISLFSPKTISIFDANFFVDRKRVRQFCELVITSGIKTSFYAMGRCDYFSRYDKPFLDLLAKAGFTEIAMGAESGSPRVLKNLHKNISPEDILTSVRNCVGSGMIPILSFIIDLPDETREDIMMTLDIYDKVIKLKGKINGIFLFVPYPGSEITGEILPDYVLPEDIYTKSLYDIKEIGYHDKNYERMCQTICFCAHLFSVYAVRSKWTFARKLMRDKSALAVIMNDLIDNLFYPIAKSRWKLRWFFFGYDLQFYWWARNLDFTMKSGK